MFYPNGEFSLGLSIAVNSHKTPPTSPEARERKGQKQTSHSKRMVRNGAWYLENHVGKKNLTFATTTLPQAAVDALEAKGDDAAGFYAEADRQMQQWIRRRLESAGLNSSIVGCVEPQPERFENTGQVALHSHLVFQGKSSKGSWVIDKDEFRNQWNKILSNVLGVKIESLASTRIERVKKSAEYYLSKYMSKAGTMVQKIIDAGKKHMLPSHWWHCSSDLRKIIKSMCLPISEDAAEILYSQREELKEKGILQWFYIHEIDVIQSHGEPLKIPVAFMAKFRKPEYIQMFT